MPPPSSRGSCSARPNRKAPCDGRGAQPGRRAFQAAPGLPGRRPGERAGEGRASRGRLSPCARARPPGPGAAVAATARRPPPRRERPAAASSSALPPARRPPTDSSAAAAADSHPPGADRRSGPGPSRWLLCAAAVTARSRPTPPPGAFSASSSDSATSSGHPGTRRKCLATRGRNCLRAPGPRRASPRPRRARLWPPSRWARHPGAPADAASAPTWVTEAISEPRPPRGHVPAPGGV